MKRILLACCLATLAWGSAGCGYQQAGSYDKPPANGYQWHSLYREDISTVAVPIFQNRSFTRGVEFRLSKAIVNKLEAHSPYKVVSRERADTILEGEITGVAINNLNHDYNTNLPQEQLAVYTLNFRWRNLRTGQILLERLNFQQTATYYPTLGEGQFVGDQAAIERLALAVVQEMQAEW